MNDEVKPMELLYHAAIPGWAKVKGLVIRPVPECEGGGYMLRLADAEMIVAASKRKHEAAARRD